MATYHIIVKNQSGKNNQYLLFNKAPQPAAGAKDGFSNVWVQTAGTPSPNGKQEFTITTDIFAMCGTLPQPLAHGVTVTESDETPVTLTGSSPGTVVQLGLINGGPEFEVPFSTTSESAAFGIRTLDWINDEYKDKVWYGMGKYDDKNSIVPVASFPAEPNQEYTLQPAITFYIGTGKFTRGEAVNVTAIGSIATIDFTQALPGQTYATVVHNGSLKYSEPVFGYPACRNGEKRLLKNIPDCGH